MTDTREFAAERWTCAGARIGSDGKRDVAWLQPDGTLVLFGDKASYALGCGYDVDVCREAGQSWKRGKPRYAGSGNATEEQLARFTVLSTEAEQELARNARERKAKGQEALAEAMEPLVKYAKACRTRSQRAALIADVIDRLTIEAWRTRGTS